MSTVRHQQLVEALNWLDTPQEDTGRDWNEPTPLPSHLSNIPSEFKDVWNEDVQFLIDDLLRGAKSRPLLEASHICGVLDGEIAVGEKVPHSAVTLLDGIRVGLSSTRREIEDELNRLEAGTSQPLPKEDELKLAIQWLEHPPPSINVGDMSIQVAIPPYLRSDSIPKYLEEEWEEEVWRLVDSSLREEGIDADGMRWGADVLDVLGGGNPELFTIRADALTTLIEVHEAIASHRLDELKHELADSKKHEPAKSLSR